MCLIMTSVTALVFTILWLVTKIRGQERKSLFTSLLMFWAAALMWSVDGIASVIGGESFFDISMEDTILGFIILALGLAIFAFLFIRESKKVKEKNEKRVLFVPLALLLILFTSFASGKSLGILRLQILLA